MNNCLPIDKLLIRSEVGRTELELSELQKNTDGVAQYLRVTLRDYGMTATSPVYVFNPDVSMQAFFAALANDADDWKNQQVWETIDGELLFSAVTGLFGDIELHVTLSAEPHPDAWIVQSVIHLDGKELKNLAAKMHDFFSVNDIGLTESLNKISTIRL